MMSMVGAAWAPDTTAALVLGDAWAPTGAAGFSAAFAYSCSCVGESALGVRPPTMTAPAPLFDKSCEGQLQIEVGSNFENDNFGSERLSCGNCPASQILE